MNIFEAQQITELFGYKGECSVVRDMGKIQTSSGVRCVKKISYGIDRLSFIHKAKEYLIKNGFRYVDRFYETPGGSPYILHNEDVFIMTDWIDGKDCDFKRMDDVKKATETLANFHKSIAGFAYNESVKIRDELGMLPITLKKRSDELLRLKRVAQKSRNRFDYLFLENVDSFIERGIAAIGVINSDAFSRVVQKARDKKEFCHRDYSFHNLVYDKSENLYMQNFDYLCAEIKVYDFASFLRKIMTEYNWNIEVALHTISWYDTVNKIDQDEIRILSALLEFPQKFWRIANRYYNSRRTRPENGFYNKLQDVVSERDVYKEFVHNFNEAVGCKN